VRMPMDPDGHVPEGGKLFIEAAGVGRIERVNRPGFSGGSNS
jgi:hypothetical protein